MYHVSGLINIFTDFLPKKFSICFCKWTWKFLRNIPKLFKFLFECDSININSSLPPSFAQSTCLSLSVSLFASVLLHFLLPSLCVCVFVCVSLSPCTPSTPTLSFFLFSHLCTIIEQSPKVSISLS